MSYTKILLTVTNALSTSRLPCNDSILTVWSVDGNIEYGSGKHLFLVVFSCGVLVLVLGLAYPVLLLCAPLLVQDTVTNVSHCTNVILWQSSSHCWMLMEDLTRTSIDFGQELPTNYHRDILFHFRKIGCH